jgi:hypothetical protein
VECLKKAGLPPSPLVLDRIAPDGWVVFRSGRMLVASIVVALSDVDQPMALAVAGPGANVERPAGCTGA